MADPPPPPGSIPPPPGAMTGQPEASSPAELFSEFGWNVHSYMNEYIRFADAKAGAVFTIGSAILTGLWVSNAHDTLTSVAVRDWSSRAYVTALAILLLFAGLLAAGIVVRPRLTSTEQQPGFIFWDRVLRHGSGSRYWDALDKQTGVALARELADHVYDLSVVARRKYRWVSLAVNATLVGAVLAGALVLLPR